MRAAEIIAIALASLPILVAIVFGVLTLRQWHRTRYLTAAAELVRMMQTAEFARSIASVMELGLETDPPIAM